MAKGERNMGEVLVSARKTAFASVLAAALALAFASAAVAFDSAAENRNFAKIQERNTQEISTPAYQTLINDRYAVDTAELNAIAANDPERDFTFNFCSSHVSTCAGDLRLYDFFTNGYGISVPVLYIGRSGAIISGHIWATRKGPAQRPGIVITTGSLQAPEEFYLYAATTLAKKGYVVMTYDVQGQGRSDTYGEAPDTNENVPPQSSGNFIRATEDAIRFFHSTPASPYVPLPSATTSTVHSTRQNNRVASGKNAAYNPLHAMFDQSKFGVAGHSLGAYAVSAVCCNDNAGRVGDTRVDAVVAWDNLSAGGGSNPTITPRVPALGMSADYGLTPAKYTADPNPDAKSTASLAYSTAGVDTMQVQVRGGTHYEYSYIPSSVYTSYGASWRGMDMAAWYTAAWFDKYLKGDPTADNRLLTRRWANDTLSQAIDQSSDPNMFSFYYRSRVDIAAAGGGRVKCGNLRTLTNTEAGDNCAAATASDGLPANNSYLADAETADSVNAYARPKGATPLRASLVPAFQACTAANRTHGPALVYPSCNPPAKRSSFLTVGSPDANGNAANSVGSVRLDVTRCTSCMPVTADVQITSSITDVRNQSGLTDYTGQLQGRFTLRPTDKYNSMAPPTAPYDDTGTGQDTSFAFTIPCSATVDTTIGGACAITTTANAVVPGLVKDGSRANWELSQAEVTDGGPDGLASTTAGNTTFAVQGLFVP
jgi:alpha-beta hydrolase superfamily lysophospholipase